MKKVLIIAVCIILILGFVTGCGKDNTETIEEDNNQNKNIVNISSYAIINNILNFVNIIKV